MKPPVLLIHGAFCGGWAMEGFASAFRAAGYQTIAPDLRHHEPGTRPRDLKSLGTTSVKDYARDMRLLIEEMDEKPIIVGHSMGGLVAQLLASRGHASGLVLLAPSAPWGVLPSGWQEMASAYGLYLAGQFWERALFPTFELAAEHALDRLPKAERHQVFSNFVPESGLAMFEILHWPMDIRRASQVPHGSVRVPVFCASGGRDRVNPPETVRRIAQRYRNSGTYRDYDAMSHWLVGEPGWEQVADDALAFAAGI